MFRNFLGNLLGLVHIDTDLYAPTKKTLLDLADAVAEGGFFLIDDYLEVQTPGVKVAIDEFLEERDDFTFIPSLVSQCLLVRASPATRRADSSVSESKDSLINRIALND